jgi:hypothetical protein
VRVRFDRFVGYFDAKYPGQLGFSAVNVSFFQERS